MSVNYRNINKLILNGDNATLKASPDLGMRQGEYLGHCEILYDCWGPGASVFHEHILLVPYRCETPEGDYRNALRPSVYPSVCPMKSWSCNNSKTIRATFMKLGLWTGGNVLIMHVIFLFCQMKIVVAMVMEIVKML